MVELPSPSAKCDLLRECSVGVISVGGVGGGGGGRMLVQATKLFNSVVQTL